MRTNLNPVPTAARTRRAPSAFTLIEMMVVLLILAVVLAIVLPTLSGARNAARKSATTGLFSELNSASSAFQFDNRRLPGYFTPTQMGSAENMTRGFTTMNSILLDLSGGIVGAASTLPDKIQVGPQAATRVWVSPSQIGAPVQTRGVATKAYFKPDEKNFVLQGTAGEQKKICSAAEHYQIRDLTDFFGNPVIAWAQDDSISANPAFASQDSDTQRARFYWASNAAFLRSRSLGRLAESQIEMSLFGADVTPDMSRIESMEAVLGNPAFPNSETPPRPTAARAPLVFHSAGANGLFLGARERGGLAAGGGSSPATATILYAVPPAPDVLDNFDDIFAKAGQ